MNAIALIVKASVSGGIAYYLYTEQEFSAWLAMSIGAVVFGLAYFMNWDGNSPTSGGGG